MLHETIILSEERKVTLTTYLIEDQAEYQHGAKRPIVVICPGGGYAFLSERESEPVALQYVAAGFHAAILRYGINEYAVAPGPLNDIAGAVAYLRDHSDVWHIDNDAVIVMGFSAGAHVAGQLGVFWNNGRLLPHYAEDLTRIKPNGMILCYPVLDLRATDTHMEIGAKPGDRPEDIPFGQKHPKMPLDKIFIMDEKEGRYFADFESAMNAYIFDGEYTSEQEDFYSLQNQVSEDTCPAFLWHCDGDGLILPSNSLDFASAMKKYHRPVELHLYAGGGHGISLANERTTCDIWNYYPYAESWMKHSIDWVEQLTGFSERITRELKH
ncbi:MAG: alpha/beta hydrolase [Eubacterium sp.]|nr:alpha/beta hydrolase [Eubacterium sp.]